MWANFNRMPKLLKLLTMYAASSFILFAISVIPLDSYSIQDRHVTYAEWWSSGAGVFASLLGLVGPFAAWALASKQPYARIAYSGFLALAFIAPGPLFDMLQYVVPGVLLVGVGTFYMYKSQSVQDYFAPNQSFKRAR